MATTTIYSSTGDIAVRVSNANFATARAATSGATSGGASTYASVGLESGTTYNFYIPFFMFDTSVISTAENINAAVMSIFLVGDNSGTAANQYTICQSTQATWNSPVGDDFDQRGSVECATRLNRKVSTETGYEDFTFTATGRGKIARSGETNPASASASGKSQFTLMYAKDLDNSAPATNDYNQVYFSDEAGTTRDPKLVVTTTLAPIYASGFGDSAANGTYTDDGTYDSQPRWVNGAGTRWIRSSAGGSPRWYIATTNSGAGTGAIYYDNNLISSDPFPYSGGVSWVDAGGGAPLGVVSQTAPAATFRPKVCIF